MSQLAYSYVCVCLMICACRAYFYEMRHPFLPSSTKFRTLFIVFECSSVSLDYEELMGRAGARDPTRWRQDEDSWLGVHYRASQSSMSRVYNFEQRRF